MKILHIFCLANTTVNNFIKFVNDNFNSKEHFFVIFGSKSPYITENKNNIIFYDSFSLKRHFINTVNSIIDLINRINLADKVIFHGLFGDFKYFILSFIPGLFRKSYWVIWGGDLYSHILKKNSLGKTIQELAKHIMCKKIGHIITYVEGDYVLAQKWYGIRSQYHESIMYPSNFYEDVLEPSMASTSLNIQIGNSADPTNNHIEILDKLKPYKTWNIKIYAPLSYGDKDYAKEIERYGKDLFGNKFEALTDFMPLTEYNKFLSNIDIAIFAHNRQQAMGNIISLLGMGKMVFIRRDITPYQLFKNLGVKIFSFENLSLLTKENLPDLISNREIIKNYFNKETLIKQLTDIFYS